jgi:hypothetical protein
MWWAKQGIIPNISNLTMFVVTNASLLLCLCLCLWLWLCLRAIPHLLDRCCRTSRPWGVPPAACGCMPCCRAAGATCGAAASQRGPHPHCRGQGQQQQWRQHCRRRLQQQQQQQGEMEVGLVGVGVTRGV